MYFLWQDLSVETKIFDLVALTLTLTYFWKNLNMYGAAGSISPVRTEPYLLKVLNLSQNIVGTAECSYCH